MKKNTIKLTESRLRNLVEACVKEALEDTFEEGYGWDIFKHAAKEIDGSENVGTFQDAKEYINGEPDANEFRRSKDSYEAAKDGMIYTDGDRRSSNPVDYAEEALLSEPGFKGKARRAAVYGGALGVLGAKKGARAVKKGFNKIKDSIGSKSNKNSGVEPFEL